MTDFGALLNTPEKSLPCPACERDDCQVAVYERAVVRDCGHTHELPPLEKKCDK